MSKACSAPRDTETASTEAAEYVTQTYDRLVRMLALIESALGIDEAVSIAKAVRSDSHSAAMTIAVPRARAQTKSPWLIDAHVSLLRAEA